LRIGLLYGVQDYTVYSPTAVAVKSTPQPPTLTRERIVQLAIERADGHGLEQLTMRKLAGGLSVTPMALYWHFANRDALLDAMAEEVAGQVAYEDRPEASWQDRLRAVLTAILNVLRDHPWLGSVARHRIVPAPNFLKVLEVLLDTLRAAGYDTQAAASVADLTIDSLAAMAAKFPAARIREPKPPSPSESQLRMRQQLDNLEGSEYPRIREAAVPLTTPDAADGYLELGLDILLGGVDSAAPGSGPRITPGHRLNRTGKNGFAP
jgi:TetR/AcrR family transcriptional regulator, tetracycline repressor protein